jgi:hypothetical protein
MRQYPPRSFSSHALAKVSGLASSIVHRRLDDKVYYESLIDVLVLDSYRR